MIRTDLNSDGTLSIGLGNEGITLKHWQVDELVAKLGDLRAQMFPGPAAEPPSVVAVDPTFDPNYWVEPDAETDNVVLLIRDLGFGWVPFLIPAKEAGALGKLLTEQAELVATRAAPAAPAEGE